MQWLKSKEKGFPYSQKYLLCSQNIISLKLLGSCRIKAVIYLTGENYQCGNTMDGFTSGTIVSFISKSIHDKAFPFSRIASSTAWLFVPLY